MLKVLLLVLLITARAQNLGSLHVRMLCACARSAQSSRSHAPHVRTLCTGCTFSIPKEDCSRNVAIYNNSDDIVQKQLKPNIAIAVIAISPTGRASFVYSCVQTRPKGHYNGN